MTQFDNLAQVPFGEIEAKLEQKIRARVKTQLRKLQRSNDVESAHSNADSILCNLLVGLGYSDVVEEWRKVRKWYA